MNSLAYVLTSSFPFVTKCLSTDSLRPSLVTGCNLSGVKRVIAASMLLEVLTGVNKYTANASPPREISSGHIDNCLAATSIPMAY